MFNIWDFLICRHLRTPLPQRVFLQNQNSKNRGATKHLSCWTTGSPFPFAHGWCSEQNTKARERLPELNCLLGGDGTCAKKKNKKKTDYHVVGERTIT